ncbi:MAG TPA: hypothetical protein VFE98_08945 [Candidatus Bathyarchaeia archaeon]|nr:hypothetical protein [Candidatus Bathyarchaeia archaeon]
MDPALGSLAVVASTIALFLMLRAKKTYFPDTGLFMAIASIAFILVLVTAIVSKLGNIPVSPLITTLLISTQAGSVGFASFLLRNNSYQNHLAARELAGFLRRPPKSFLAYIAILLVWTTVGLVFQPWHLTPVPPQSRVIVYDPSYILLSTALLVSFITLPVMSFYRKSFWINDVQASRSVRVISICWALFGLVTFVQNALVFISPSVVEDIAALVDSGLFILISFALREPTILARMIGTVEQMRPEMYSGDRTGAIVVYDGQSDRRTPIATFLSEGLAKGQHINCFVPKNEIPFYRALIRDVVEAQPTQLPNTTTVESHEALVSDGYAKSPTSESQGRQRREVIDLDELPLGECFKIIEKVTGARTPLVHRCLWAVNIDGGNSAVVTELAERNPNSVVINLAQQQHNFSGLFGMNHDQLLGSRVLLESDPTSPYEEVIEKFVGEFQAHVETIAIFTSVGSPIYRLFLDNVNVRVFGFSTKTSTPAKLSEEIVLLPERDTSLLLDALDKLLRAHSNHRIGIVFDVFTDLILSQGIEKVYGTLSSVVELSESDLVTTIFLINYAAIDERTLNGIRGLFRSIVKIDATGVRTENLNRTDSDARRESSGLLDPNQQAVKGELTI